MNILLIEDNPGDIRLIKEAFGETSTDYSLSVATDGMMATSFLHKTGTYSKAITPDLILLDLNLPKKDGRIILKELKEDLRLRKIPVIVLSNSNSRLDVSHSYESYANCFIQKPRDFEGYKTITNEIKEFWGNTVKLPSISI